MTSCIPLPKCIREMDNDTVEKIQGYIAMGGMFVKILMASFPMMFVPQLCDGEPCSMSDKFLGWNWLMLVNVTTFCSFCNLYYIQAKREFFMIDYFDEDDDKSENALFDEIEHYPLIKRKINKLNKKIGSANTACIVFFGINTIWSSGFILAQRYLDATTITVLLTNSILVQGKLMQIRDAHTSEDLAQSSVGTRPKKYNIIDVDKRNLELGIYPAIADSKEEASASPQINMLDISVHDSKDKELYKLGEEGNFDNTKALPEKELKIIIENKPELMKSPTTSPTSNGASNVASNVAEKSEQKDEIPEV